MSNKNKKIQLVFTDREVRTTTFLAPDEEALADELLKDITVGKGKSWCG